MFAAGMGKKPPSIKNQQILPHRHRRKLERKVKVCQVRTYYRLRDRQSRSTSSTHLFVRDQRPFNVPWVYGYIANHENCAENAVQQQLTTRQITTHNNLDTPTHHHHTLTIISLCSKAVLEQHTSRSYQSIKRQYAFQQRSYLRLVPCGSRIGFCFLNPT